MSGKAVTEEKINWLKETLAKNPELTKAHFHKCGYSYEWMKAQEAAGVVKFGKQKSKTGGWR